MEGCHFDDQANNMEDLRRQVQQFSEHLARYKTQNRDDENLNFQDVNPFHFHAPAGEPGEEEFVERPRQNQRTRDVDLKDIPEFKGKIQPDEFIDWLNTVECIFYLKEVSVKRKVKVVMPRLLFQRGRFSFVWHGLKCCEEEVTSDV